MGDRFRQFLSLEIRRRPELMKVYTVTLPYDPKWNKNPSPQVIAAERELYDLLKVSEITSEFIRFLKLNYPGFLTDQVFASLKDRVEKLEKKFVPLVDTYDKQKDPKKRMDLSDALAPGHPRDDLISALDDIADDVAEHWQRGMAPQVPSKNGPLTAKVRPLKPGYSVAYQGSPSQGTIGGFIYSKGSAYLLSNAHILVAKPFDPTVSANIVQPAPEDGGSEVVGKVVHHFQLKAAVANDMDAAIAKLESDMVVSPEYDRIGALTGLRDAQLHETLRMASRTSGYIEAVVEEINTTTKVANWLNPGHAAIPFQGVVKLKRGVGTHTNLEGDSGGLWIGQDNKAVALNFAGGEWSDSASAFPIKAVLAFFKQELKDPNAGLMGLDSNTFS